MSVKIQEKVSLAKYTSWLVGGDAQHFCLPESVDELKEALLWAHRGSHELTLIGGGSNILISDHGIRGLVICLRKLSGLTVEETDLDLKVTALAGTGKNELLKLFLKKKLAPALFLAGLPGDVGGGVVMNAGVAEAFEPREFNEIVDWVEVLRMEGGEVKTLAFQAKELEWNYRHSLGWQPGVISRVGIKWPLKEDPEVLQKVRAANKVRLSKQPLDKPSCGSVFRNPEGYKSAALIDACELKGYSVGGAQVSTKHANFIVNTGGAQASDIKAVINHVKAEVHRQRGVLLQEEVVYLGQF